jgi:hypothetical protein
LSRKAALPASRYRLFQFIPRTFPFTGPIEA